MIKSPAFWQNPQSPYGKILLPLSAIYNFFRKLKIKKSSPKKTPLKIVCIGNLTFGGAGKTPVSIAIKDILDKYHVSSCFLSRGYGGSLEGPVKVSRLFHSAQEVGDEPILLAQHGLTIVAKDRYAGALAAHKGSAKIAILDDGFQNFSLQKDLNLLVVDGTIGFGNEYLFPAGPLREPIDEGLRNSDALIVIGTPSTRLEEILKGYDKPIFKATTKAFLPKDLAPQQEVMAFCGIGYPEKFFKTLQELQLNVKQLIPFADHHFYKLPEIERLKLLAKREDVPLLTTEKDYVRLTARQKHGIIPIPLSLKWGNEKKLRAFLEEHLCLTSEN
jgi:tetraacyldisaccharide 4'-kinase